ncbi:hypothetical protein DWU98_13520 [Dyella monticola]|uniref:Uncharacterized protein n=1 Tax=Dyella monticola TaxID=1927958 RepID=A0A370WWU3_9GAMM|nr:hypothetical protein [Dyella monticola]RDS80445.1 hypothetical protein DWU98_13520 [Dyella monticola]
MASAPQYEIAFQFRFQQDVSNQVVQIDIADQNRFIISDQQKAQLSALADNPMPPLNNMSVSSMSFYLNIASGKVDEGVETFLWTTFINSGPVEVSLTMSSLVAASYVVLGVSSSGVLMPGLNYIGLVSGA